MRAVNAFLILFSLFIFLAACSQEEVNHMKEMKISSPNFQNNERIPEKYTCDGEDINPTIHIEDIPEGTKSLVLIVDDPDAPIGTWVHWVVFNIPPTNLIEEDSVPGTEAMNNFERTSYGGPCPPSGVHRYFFKVYALDTELSLTEDATKDNVEDAMTDHILGKGELIGVYSRS